jgi:hypothetical protein
MFCILLIIVSKCRALNCVVCLPALSKTGESGSRTQRLESSRFTHAPQVMYRLICIRRRPLDSSPFTVTCYHLPHPRVHEIQMVHWSNGHEASLWSLGEVKVQTGDCEWTLGLIIYDEALDHWCVPIQNPVCSIMKPRACMPFAKWNLNTLASF